MLSRFASILSLYKLSEDVQDSTARISELVGAIKEYSWMDTNPERDIDIHAGLESTSRFSSTGFAGRYELNGSTIQTYHSSARMAESSNRLDQPYQQRDRRDDRWRR